MNDTYKEYDEEYTFLVLFFHSQAKFNVITYNIRKV